MKRHFRNVGVFPSAKHHTEKDACFEFISDGHRLFLHFDSRWDLVFLAQQIRDLLRKDLERDQSRLEVFKSEP